MERQPRQEVACDVWPEHSDALNLFMQCLDQLQISIGMGGVSWRGASSASVLQEARWLGMGCKRQRAVVPQYRVMEREALRILNEREARAAAKK
jgi:hypothetical protein